MYVLSYSNVHSELYFTRARALTGRLSECLCRIERSRTILPCLVSAVEKAGTRRVNWQYFYKLLFTTANLRLVHIVCHDKASHERFTCDMSQVFVR